MAWLVSGSEADKYPYPPDRPVSGGQYFLGFSRVGRLPPAVVPRCGGRGGRPTREKNRTPTDSVDMDIPRARTWAHRVQLSARPCRALGLPRARVQPLARPWLGSCVRSAISQAVPCPWRGSAVPARNCKALPRAGGSYAVPDEIETLLPAPGGPSLRIQPQGFTSTNIPGKIV